MAKIKYADFNDYFQNDKKFFIRLLKDEVHKPQSKIYFADGTTYHVTKAGSRYWEYPGYGWKSQYKRGSESVTHYYCSGAKCDTEAEFLAAIDRLKAERLIVESETVDIHPVIMTMDSDRWVDPTIDDWYEENFWYNDAGCYSTLQCISLKASDDESSVGVLQVWFKSDYMTNKIDSYTVASRTDKSLRMDQFPYVNTKKVIDSFINMYKDDTRDSRFDRRIKDFIEEVGGRFSYVIRPHRVLFKDGTHYWCE